MRLTLPVTLRRFLLAASLLLLVRLISPPLMAQDVTEPGIVVTGQELPSAYGAPPGFSRTRFSPLLTAYVLPPGSILSATIWEGDWYPEGPRQDFFTQEIEIGLPHRFGVAMEWQNEVVDDVAQVRALSVEGRYALADWNKIPLNPTLFFEYKWGLGRIYRDEKIGPSDDMMDMQSFKRRLGSHKVRAQEDDMEEEGQPPSIPDAVEGRLLLSQDFGEHVEWALNAFFEQEVGGDRGREWGFAQSVVVPLTKNETVKAGVEMRYTNFTDKDTRDDADNRFVIGPTFAVKPSRWSRIDVSPLFGVNRDSPDAQVFVVFSMILGGRPGEHEAEAPASTRNR